MEETASFEGNKEGETTANKERVASNASPGRISNASTGTSVASMHAQTLEVGYCFVQSSNHAHRSLENRQPRWTNLECPKGSDGPCAPSLGQ
jgi:hypothetical protein